MIPKCLNQNYYKHRRFANETKVIARNPPRNQHLHNFHAAHDLMKVSTTRINHKEALIVPLAIPNKKWPCSHLDHAFQNLLLPLPYMHAWDKENEKIIHPSFIQYEMFIPYSLMTLSYKYKCCIFSRGPPYMYMIVNYNMCNICLCSTKKIKLITLLCSHVYSYVLWKV